MRYVTHCFNGLICTSFLLACVLLPSAAKAAEKAARPNLLIILADDMGYGDLSCYGSKQIQSPHIDRLAEGGIRATQAYVAMMVCAPSRAGIMTGRNPCRFGFEHNLVHSSNFYAPEKVGLPLDEVTIADHLKSAGYNTACIGKWHLGGDFEHHPNSRGFDYYFGRFKGHGYFPKVEDRQVYRQREPVEQIDVPYTTDWYTKETIDFIDRVPEGQPWFVYLAHDTPHTPLQAKPEDIARFSHIQPKNRRLYCAMQHCLDQNVGRLTSHLIKTGQLDNTLIVFLSDNGGTTNGSINAPLRGAKATFLEGGLRVPMIFHWPAELPSSITYTLPITSLDFLPTFTAAAGVPLKRKSRLDGVNLLPYFSATSSTGSKPGRPHSELYFRMTLRGAAYRDGDWKLLRLPHRQAELYDLSSDESELNNLATSKPERVRDMMHRLSLWEESLAGTPRWISSNTWKTKNRKLYDKKYTLSQPE